VVFVDRRYSSLGLKGSPLYTYEHVVDHHDDDATRFLYRAQSAVLRRARNVPEHRVLALVHVRDELRADGVSWMRQGSTVPTRPRLCGHLPVPGLVPLLRALPVGPEPRQSGAEKPQDIANIVIDRCSVTRSADGGIDVTGPRSGR
jgi:hypothetical protein